MAENYVIDLYKVVTEENPGVINSKQSIVQTTEICGALAAAENPKRFFSVEAQQDVLIANRRGVKRDCVCLSRRGY